MNTPEQIREEFKKKQKASHEIWLQAPQTQLALQLIKSRGDKFKISLQEGILSASNEKEETKLRVSYTTCLAIHKILTNPDLFVEETTKEKQ